eukprot:4508514-Karenia_brevis.AAC.1
MMAKIAQDRSREPKRINMIAQVGQESSKRAQRETQDWQSREGTRATGDSYLLSRTLSSL